MAKRNELGLANPHEERIAFYASLTARGAAKGNGTAIELLKASGRGTALIAVFTVIASTFDW